MEKYPQGQLASRLPYFVVLCNGTREQAEALREELCLFLKGCLKLTLSMEKTKVTHLNDGFLFLGFKVQRRPGHNGMKTKVLIPQEAVAKVMDKVTAATDPTTSQDSVTTKILAINRIIGGWCQYYQYTSKASSTFGKIDHKTFWLMAHWLGRKFQLSIPAVMKRYGRGTSLGTPTYQLVRGSVRYPTRHYKKRYLKPNPYTTQDQIRREEPPEETSWSGYESRPGMADLRPTVLARDEYRCQSCGQQVTASMAEVDHIRSVRRFKKPVDANTLDNLQTLCIQCHREKTESDQQRESPVR